MAVWFNSKTVDAGPHHRRLTRVGDDNPQLWRTGVRQVSGELVCDCGTDPGSLVFVLLASLSCDIVPFLGRSRRRMDFGKSRSPLPPPIFTERTASVTELNARSLM
jgi:hypothetical protein